MDRRLRRNNGKRRVDVFVHLDTSNSNKNPYLYNHKQPVHHESYDSTVCWWLFWLVLIGIFITIVVLLFTHPYPVATYYRDQSPLGKKDGNYVRNCTVGEQMDYSLDLCSPITNVPIPIVSVLMNQSIGVCKSFFHHQVGGWISTHKNENRAFTYTYRKNQKQVHDLIRSPDSGPLYKFFRSCLDTLVNGKHERLDGEQVKHVREHILGALKTHQDLPVVFARLASYGFTSPFTITIESHPTKAQMVPLFRFDGFIDEDTDMEVVRTLNEWYTDVEDDEAGTFVGYVLSERYEKNMMKMGALIDLAPRNFWKLYLRELNGYAMEEDLEMASRDVWVITPNYIRTLLSNMYTISVEDWRKFVDFSITYNTKDFIPHLPSDSYFRRHEWQPIGAGIHVPHRLKRKKRVDYTEHTCLSITHRLLPGLVGEVFLQRVMPKHMDIRNTINRVVERVRDSYADLITQTPWMTPETKNKAVEKIRSIIVRTVMPNHWEAEPFAGRLTVDCYLRNLNMIRQYRARRNFELWTSKKPDRDFIQRFSSPLTEVNAFYSPITNTITVFAGILREPFYNPEFSEMATYATVGMIAGHELGHALDNNGRMFDKDGNVRDWWTQEDVKAFNDRVKCVVEEYTAPFGCENEQYGEQTVGEDMSDIVGIKMAYNAYFGSRPNASVTEKQQFFGIFAQIWAESYDSEHLCQLVKDDEHAIAWFRVDKTLRNTPEFREVYGCRETDDMVHKTPCVVYGK